ncbi:hypothetical protein [Kribbella sp. NBC_00662]
MHTWLRRYEGLAGLVTRSRGPADVAEFRTDRIFRDLATWPPPGSRL